MTMVWGTSAVDVPPVTDLLRNQPSIPDVHHGSAQGKESTHLKYEPGQWYSFCFLPVTTCGTSFMHMGTFLGDDVML